MLKKNIKPYLNGKSWIKRKSYFELLEDLEESQKEYNNIFDLIKNYGLSPIGTLKEKLDNSYNHILLLKYYISRNTCYKKINVEYDGEYGEENIKIQFPPNTKKSFIYKWLEVNDLLTEHFHIDSMYDCTGRLVSRYTNIRNNTVYIHKTYDV